MFIYDANQETLHFVNWLLLSGKIQPTELVAQAKKNGQEIVAQESLPPGVKHDDYLAAAIEANLSIALECFLDKWIGEVCPDLNECGPDYGGRWQVGRDYNFVDKLGWPFPDRPDFYERSGLCCLVGPLLASAIHQIDFAKAARLILREVSPADVSKGVSWFAHGYNWAKTQAKSAQLSGLEIFAAGMDENEWNLWFDTRSQDAYTAAERLFFILWSQLEGDRAAAAKYWKKEMEDYEVREFADGALQYIHDNN